MRLMSFSMTIAQVRNETKTVTRRCGWLMAKVGDRMLAIEKGQGLKKGEHVKSIKPIEIIDVRREQLRRMTDEPKYGLVECRKEGFTGNHLMATPNGFVEEFCKHNDVTNDTVITRLEFKYVMD